MKRKNVAETYKWNFEHLYANTEAWKTELQVINEIGDKLASFKGHLAEPGQLKAYFELGETFNNKIVKLAQYLHYGDIDTTDNEFNQLNSLFQITYYQINQKLTFFDNELVKIGEEKINKLIGNDDFLGRYRYFFRDLFRSAKYLLDIKSEELLSKVARSRSGAAHLYDTLVYADKKPIYIQYKGKKTELTPSVYTEIMESTDLIKEQDFRVMVNRRFSEQIVDKKHSLAKVYEANLIHTMENIRLRKFDSPLQAALLGDNVDPQVYLNLITYAKKNVDLIRVYGEHKKKYFGFKKYYPTDHSLKLTKPKQLKYDVATGQNIIRTALQPLGTEYAKYIDIAWADNLIDYFPDTNKRDGAYSSGGGPVDPIILMNWDDSLRSVATLAHETGHSIHSLIASKHQKYPLYEYPIILAEVASTVNEHLLFDHLLSTIKDRDTKVYLLQNRIDDLIGTFFRQVQFAEFEYKIHEMVAADQPLTADILADTFEDLARTYSNDLFDKADPKRKAFGWPRILHFFHSPFYVYKYATSVVASFKFYQDIKDGHPDRLLSFLKAGGHKEPLDILKDFNIDFNNQVLYQHLINYLTNLIEELAHILKEQ